MTEEMAKAGRSRIIKNLAPSLTERGKIKIGEKGKMITSQGGAKFQLPKKLEYFKVVSLYRGEDGNYINDMAVHDMFGDKPTELPVRLLFDDIELNFQCRYSCFKGKQQWCSGDGEYGWRIENGETKAYPCPCHRQDPAYTGKDKCKINSCLSVLIDGVETIGGVWKFRTTSYNSTVGLLSSLTLIKQVTGGPLAGIPLTLYISPKTVISPADGKVQTIYIVGLEYKGSFENLQELGYTHALDRQKHMIRMEDIEDNARKLLQAGDTIVDEDVVEEFYPEQMVESSEQKAADLTEKVKKKPEYKVQEDPAETLKDKLDAGDEQAEGYQPLTPEEEKDLRAKLELQKQRLEKGEPKAKTLFQKIKGAKSSFEGMCVRFKDAIKDMDEKEQEYLTDKWNRLCLGKPIPFRPLAKEEQPSLPDDDQIPEFERNQETDAANGRRVHFLARMREYKEKNSDFYAAVLMDNSTEENPLNSMNYVKHGDQDAILEFMRIEFDKEV